jgi:hypothetical protein
MTVHEALEKIVGPGHGRDLEEAEAFGGEMAACSIRIRAGETDASSAPGSVLRAPSI